jgi:adenosylhomocysteine nucleosidase
MKSILGLIVALSAEGRSLLGRKGWRREREGILRRLRLNDGTNMVCVCSGVGIENALSAARRLADEGASALAVTGVAGGLSPGIKTGDLIIAETVLEKEDEKKDRIWNTDTLYTDLVRKALVAEGLTAHPGILISTTQPVFTTQTKRYFYRRHQALAVDMESAGVAHAAEEAGLPFFILRAVCDTFEEYVPPDFFACIDPNGDVRLPVLFRRLWLSPSSIVALLRMRKKFGIALAALKRGWQVQINYGLPALLVSRQLNRGMRIQY